jgi:predicted DNA-binding protein (MmcQ/YjbR family)
MNIEEYRNYCIAKKGVTECFPFDNKTLVFKVMNKMFSLTNVDVFGFVNLKCNPEKAMGLRYIFDGITGAFHMSKKHWNSVSIESNVSDQLIYELIDHSYDLVTGALTKKRQKELEEL